VQLEQGSDAGGEDQGNRTVEKGPLGRRILILGVFGVLIDPGDPNHLLCGRFGDRRGETVLDKIEVVPSALWLFLS
jgi:hypothetical protein